MKFFTKKNSTNVISLFISMCFFLKGKSFFKQDVAMGIDPVLFQVNIVLYEVESKYIKQHDLLRSART